MEKIIQHATEKSCYTSTHEILACLPIPMSMESPSTRWWNQNAGSDLSTNLQSITVSKFHFEIHHDIESGSAFIVDRSSNGTYVDDHKVAK